MKKKESYIFFAVIILFYSSVNISGHVCDYRYEQQNEETSDNPWRKVQNQSLNSVVQIFTAKAAFDWFEPYKTPQQDRGCASGFFINESGDIITNFHVVDEVVAVWITIPSLSKKWLRVNVVGVCPEFDLALLRLDKESFDFITAISGPINYLSLGDSYTINRSDEILLLGYPLGEESLKSTSGVISGQSNMNIQIDAAANPGNSGGPCLNKQGEVIGILSSGNTKAQNTNFAIPINMLKIILPSLYSHELLKNPFFGIIWHYINDTLVDYCGNPQPGGLFINDVVKGGLFDSAGLQAGDMIYQIDGHDVDIYGDLRAPWNNEKIKWYVYLKQLPLKTEVSLLVYRNGIATEKNFTIETPDCTGIIKKYPPYDVVDYEVFGGMVIMSLTENHIMLFSEKIPALNRYLTNFYNDEPRLIVTNIFPNSELTKIRNVGIGDTINEINGEKVQTLHELREALRKSLDTNHVIIKTMNERALNNNLLTVLSFKNSCIETEQLSKMYRYPLSDYIKELIQEAKTI